MYLISKKLFLSIPVFGFQGRTSGEEMGSYILTVKAKFLLIETLYYTYKEDKQRLHKEYQDFNRSAQ